MKKSMSTAEIWKEFSDELLGFIRSRVNHRDHAEDILQDVFVKIHQKVDQLSDSSKLVSWMYQITRNAIIDYYRKKKLPTSEAILIPEEFEEEHASMNPQFVKCLSPFINQLPEIYYEAIAKTVLGDLSQKEYAESLGISYTAAKSRVQRAKQKLKSQFTDCCQIQSDSYGNILSSNNDHCSC